MAASHQTANAIARVIIKQVGRKQAKLIVADLLKIRGNASFVETVKRVAGAGPYCLNRSQHRKKCLRLTRGGPARLAFDGFAPSR
jgi:hypothetical protein